jgi:hypothetical protein
MKALIDLVSAAITQEAAHAGTIRNRMLDATRGTPDFDVALWSNAETIDAAARTLASQSLPAVVATNVRALCKPSGRAREKIVCVTGWKRVS